VNGPVVENETTPSLVGGLDNIAGFVSLHMGRGVAQWLAHQHGGLGVARSNRVAPILSTTESFKTDTFHVEHDFSHARKIVLANRVDDI